MAFFENTKKKIGKTASRRNAVRKIKHARSKKSVQGEGHDIILAPWLSEKALIATERGVYVFAVSLRSTKAEIAGAIRDIYKISPRAIRTVTILGKRKTMRGKRGVGTRAKRRKAYVYLNAGESIQFA